LASVTFDGVSKVYDNGFKAVDTLDLTIRDGEFMVLVGPSGCGKTTALRMLAGLEEISEGELVIDDTVVNDVAPQKRDIAMVFQNYALYPHLSVYDNMAYGLKVQKLGKAEIRQRVTEIADVIGLTDLLDRKPKALSGASASAWRWAARSCAGRRCS
jgi:multiple sugar transport system ATP-binding protein